MNDLLTNSIMYTSSYYILPTGSKMKGTVPGKERNEWRLDKTQGSPDQAAWSVLVTIQSYNRLNLWFLRSPQYLWPIDFWAWISSAMYIWHTLCKGALSKNINWFNIISIIMRIMRANIPVNINNKRCKRLTRISNIVKELFHLKPHTPFVGKVQ